MKKSIQLVSKGKYKLNSHQLDDSINSDIYSSIENCKASSNNSSNENDESINSEDYSSIDTYKISPNEQLIAVISKYSSIEENSSCVYTIVFINVKQNKIFFKTQFNSQEEYDRFPCKFSEDSQYFVCLNESKGFAINLKNKKQIDLNLFADEIISIDINNNIKFSQNNSTIISYSLEREKKITQSFFHLNDFRLLDQINDQIYFAKDEEDDSLKMIYKNKILKSTLSKYSDDVEDSTYKVLDNHLYIEYNGIMEDMINSNLFDFRSGKRIRSFNNTNKMITNYQEKNNSTYIFYIDEPKLFRFNLLTGINKELLFVRESENYEDEIVILSENLYATFEDESLKYYNFKK